ncbi:hyaluronan mediated motility receptor-like [Portunus trituberculatus]|uniref:hyaluronan mediated motility receptor-like n=1 Tax=Portunus trituberculatus TaxID=210409 RepID=UPI001E1CD3AE|nr:hyaluronan mediated motility receptor-like [Portunus trituberculatus]
MFSKAKIKRFNEEVGCAPPPTAYNPKLEKKVAAAVSLDKSDRWKGHGEDTPGPGAYTTTSTSSSTSSPKKKMASSSSAGRLNSSTCSNLSSGSSSGFFVSPMPPARFASVGRGGAGGKDVELQGRIRELTQERDQLKTDIATLKLRLRDLERAHRRQVSDAGTDTAEVFLPSLTSEGSQTDEACVGTSQDAGEDTPPPPPPPSPSSTTALRKALSTTQEELQEAQHTISRLTGEHSNLQHRLEQLQEQPQQGPLDPALLKEQLDHLTQLRDNLEATLLQKEDLIAELRLQLDEVVAEGNHTQQQLQVTLSESRSLREEAEGRVHDLVARYEALARQHGQEREQHKEELAKRDIEIELLNGSLSNLNSKVSEYEETLTGLQEEVMQRTHRISQLEESVQDLTTLRRDRDLKEEELSLKTKEMVQMEETLEEVEGEWKGLLSTLEEEREHMKKLSAKVHKMEMELKEKEVLQQFLEKEITAREEEIRQSSLRVQEVEGELETVRRVALDLQEEAEVKLNEVLALKASVTAKDQHLETQSDLISTLQQEVSQKANETITLQEKFAAQVGTTSKVEEDLEEKTKEIKRLEEEVCNLKRSLMEKEERSSQVEESNHQLEERVVELMGEISDREAQFVLRVSGMEGEMDELSVKYSEALLEHEATRRVLGQASEELSREALVRAAAERQAQDLRQRLDDTLAEKEADDAHMKDLVRKYTNLEDALACEEAENRDLEERLEEARAATAAVRSELTATQTATDGFKTQITQLKIDMRKKCDAVEEMQQCIETLREEKQHLSSVRDNLEESVSALHLQAASSEREAEEERVTFRSRIADLENHLKEAEEEVEKEKEKAVKVKEELVQVEEQLREVEQREREQVERVSQLSGRVEELEADCGGYKDQLRNLETSLQDKTAELEVHHQETTSVLQTTANTLRQEVQRSPPPSPPPPLNSNPSELHWQRKMRRWTDWSTLAEVNRLVKEAEERKGDQETIERLEGELMEVKEALARLEAEQEDSEALRKDMEEWKKKCLHLENMVEPFRAQLDAYEVEKNGLLEQSSAAKDEVDKLSQRYATLLGHQNHKQKIHHVRQLKADNNQLKEEVHKLRQEAERQRKTVRRLEDKLVKAAGSTSSSSKHGDTSRLYAGDKENTASSSSFFDPPSLSSTPLRPSNRPQRL